MTYKTILVHLNHEPRARRIVGVACDLARAFDAHLIGLFVHPSFKTLMGLPIGRETSADLRATVEQEAAALQTQFEAATAGEAFTREWRTVMTDRRDPALPVIEAARAADLTVTSQTDPNWALSSSLDFPERLVMGAGRPVIVVPNHGQHHGVPSRVAIAWNQGRESARATADALQLLQAADHVHLLSIAHGGEAESERQSSADIEAALIRQRVNLQVSRAIATEFTVGEEIRARAVDLGAGMIVMGCYGHSRMREYALGGVTRHMLRDMSVPIFFSH